MPTAQEFQLLFGEKGDAWRAWKADLGIEELVHLYGAGGESVKVTVRPIEQKPSWYHGRIATLVEGTRVFRADDQAALNLKPDLYATYAFVNDRWVFLRPPQAALEILERQKRRG